MYVIPKAEDCEEFKPGGMDTFLFVWQGATKVYNAEDGRCERGGFDSGCRKKVDIESFPMLQNNIFNG